MIGHVHYKFDKCEAKYEENFLLEAWYGKFTYVLCKFWKPQLCGLSRFRAYEARKLCQGKHETLKVIKVIQLWRVGQIGNVIG